MCICSAPGRMRLDFQETASKLETSKKKKKSKQTTIKKDRTIFFPSFLRAREAGGLAGSSSLPPKQSSLDSGSAHVEFCVPWWLPRALAAPRPQQPWD